jgi:hypothetical protein
VPCIVEALALAELLDEPEIKASGLPLPARGGGYPARKALQKNEMAAVHTLLMMAAVHV